MNSSLTSATRAIASPRVFVLFCVLFIAALSAGCVSLQSTHQVKLDHTQLRDVLLDYHDDQILDNLIRARNGLPIVHFDFSHITAQVTTKISPSIGGNRTTTDMSSTTPTNSAVATDTTTNAPTGQTITNAVARTTGGVIGAVTHTLLKPFTWSLSGDRINVVNVEVDPALHDDIIYDAYRAFLSNSPDALRSSPAKPPAADVLLGPKLWRDGQYYWVSIAYRDQLFALGYTTVARGNTGKKSELTKSLDEFNSLQRQSILSQPQ